MIINYSYNNSMASYNNLMNLNNNKCPDIFQLSQQLEQQKEDKMYEMEARKIANAYRKVQSLRVSNSVHKQHKEQGRKTKQESAYAIKIKETLREINANKAKEMQPANKNSIPKQKMRDNSRQVLKLHQIAGNKMFEAVQKYNQRVVSRSFALILNCYHSDLSQQQKFIKRFKLFKIFRALKQEVMLAKLEREKQHQKTSAFAEKQELAKQFHGFILIKKGFKVWNLQIRRQIKRKQYEKELRRRQIQQQLKTQKYKSRNVVQQNEQLHNKMRGFLDGLKNKIGPKNTADKDQNRDRLITIKQKTEQSQGRYRFSGNTEQSNEEQLLEIQIKEDHSRQNQNISDINAQHQNIVSKVQTEEGKKASSNEDLQKMRRQLESKYKNRKQGLQKMRREKQGKKRQQQRQRVQLQRQIQIEQKRMKQQKYKQYLRNKQEQQEWEMRESLLTERADEFNKHRLKKFYGWNPWTSIKVIRTHNAQTLYHHLLLIIFRIKGQQFLSNLETISNRILSHLDDNMMKKWRLNRLKNVFQSFRLNRQYERSRKEEYSIMHAVNTVKIFLAEWKRISPAIALQNFEWQKPRNRRAKQFHRLQLLQKSLEGLKVNGISQQKQRCIAQQKQKIKHKFRELLMEESEVNYQDFL